MQSVHLATNVKKRIEIRMRRSFSQIDNNRLVQYRFICKVIFIGIEREKERDFREPDFCYQNY